MYGSLGTPDRITDIQPKQRTRGGKALLLTSRARCALTLFHFFMRRLDARPGGASGSCVVFPIGAGAGSCVRAVDALGYPVGFFRLLERVAGIFDGCNRDGSGVAA